MKKVSQIIVYIDYETDERCGASGCDSIGGIAVVVEGDNVMHDISTGLVGQYMSCIDRKEIINEVRSLGYEVSDDVDFDTQEC